jgi:hypothetical protein
MTHHREDIGVCEAFGAARCVGECRFPTECSAKPLIKQSVMTAALPSRAYRYFPAEMAKIWAIRPDTRDEAQRDQDEYDQFGGY